MQTPGLLSPPTVLICEGCLQECHFCFHPCPDHLPPCQHPLWMKNSKLDNVHTQLWNLYRTCLPQNQHMDHMKKQIGEIIYGISQDYLKCDNCKLLFDLTQAENFLAHALVCGQSIDL